jgi:hypothetical protein
MKRSDQRPEGHKRETPNIWIERAECLVPRRGTQQKNIELRDELRQSDPRLAADIESQPWYQQPDAYGAGDDWATLNWEWMGVDQILMGWTSYLPVADLPLITEQTLGRVYQHSVEGVESDNWIDYSVNVKASYAFSVLRDAGMIPVDSILMNESEVPLSCDEEELEAI